MADRRRKTPRERAEEALGIAQRRVAKAEKRVKTAERAVTTAKTELREAERRLAYVQQDPALPQAPESDAPTTAEEGQG